MHMKEELENQFQLVLKVNKKMDHYVIQLAKKDIMVWDLYVGKAALPDLLMEELIALNQHPTEEEQEKFRNHYVKVHKALRRKDYYGIRNAD